MFLKNKNIILEIRRSKVTDYAALISQCGAHQKTSTPYMDQTLRKCHLLNIRFMSFLKHPPGRRQSITLLTIDERGSKIARNSVFDCHFMLI